MTNESTPWAQPVLIGELLLDRFPSGAVVLGGAPFIVSWHLQGFGASPYLISRVGRDREGEQILQTMTTWGMDRSGIQLDPSHPTGTVEVTLPHGQPSFHILPNQAYDFIDGDLALQSLEPITPLLLYHGTLATRIPCARQVLLELRQRTGLPIFLDLNLRDPWWDRRWLQQVLAQARWLKVNQTELAVVFQQTEMALTEVPRYAQELQHSYGYDFVIVTLGEAGALLALPDRIVTQTAPRLDAVVDTVGAGDAFSAIAVLGIQRGWSPEQILDRGVQFASEICQIPGGTTKEKERYTRHLQSWARSAEGCSS